MPTSRLKEFLDDRHVRYQSITHPRAITAQEVAATAHIPGRDFAKTVMVRIDGRMAMVVVPASMRVDLGLLKTATGADSVELATESEFRDAFPECELGAMPPFGNLYDGMFTFVADVLADEEEIAFNAGSHTEVVKMAYNDFARLARPMLVDLGKGQ
jgi:Ala-tRNA(Pro) deacylase